MPNMHGPYAIYTWWDLSLPLFFFLNFFWMLNDQLTVKSINDVPKVLYKYRTRILSISNENIIHFIV